MYRLEITTSASRSLEKLENRLSDYDFDRIIEAVRSLAIEPRPNGALKLQGKHDIYRVKVGKFRIVYEILDKKLLVIILQVARRNENTYH